MELVRGLVNLRERHCGSVVTIGSFDGLHCGHQALIERARAMAARRGGRAMMVSFEPLPREYLAPAEPPARLTSFRERCKLAARYGVELLCLLRFTEELRRLSGADFMRLLAERLCCTGVVVGHDFRFGRGGEASASTLLAAAGDAGLEVEIVPPVVLDGERVSSTAVRAALAAGDFDRAARLLGRRYSMRGRVVPGERLGRTLGFPTANLRLERRRSPLWGIFAVRVHDESRAAKLPPGRARGAIARQGGGVPAVRELRGWPGVASLGTRPTVGGIEPVLEVHLFDFAGDLYAREIEVEFVKKLRDEERFESLEALVAQMHRDAQAARRLLAA